MSDRLGSTVNAAPCTALRSTAQQTDASSHITLLSALHLFLSLLAVSAFSVALCLGPLYTFLPSAEFFFISISPLTHGDDLCQRLAMMMSLDALERLPREGSFVW